jgi:hypothetical protein
MRDFGSIIYYLGLNMMRDKKIRTIYVTQIAAIDRIFEEIRITEYLSCTTSMKLGLQLEKV